MQTLQKADFLYQKIADNFEGQILAEIMKTGDKLPSIRTICRQYGVSASTALQAYYYLESRKLIKARPNSGYYVHYQANRFRSPDKSTTPDEETDNRLADNLISRVFQEIARHDETVMFSLGVPSTDLLPVAKLNKAMISALRSLPSGGTGYEHIQGNVKLRRQIAHWAYTWNGKFTEDEVVTTAGCINAIAFCLSALTKPGDTIAVESPCYFGVLQLARSLGLNIKEIPTNYRYGIDLDELKKAVEAGKIDICLLVSNFSNPLGSCIPTENKRAIVELLEKHNIPLIEDDLYGDMYFGKQRPLTCKSFDESGNVLLCSSVSKTLAPGYRVGWVIPGKYKEKVLNTKLYQTISTTTLTQEVIADFMENGRYEYHLNKMRNALFGNLMQLIRAISLYFPESTKIHQPEGGFMLWVELDENTDTVILFEEALRHKISIAPGRLFTTQDLYRNCLRMNYSWLWNERIENAIKILGNLVRKQG